MISVIMRSYNQSGFIGHAIESVLSQTYKDFELIAVDDGSTDDTGSILQKYSDQIRLIRQENKGRSAAANVGLAEARGDYVAFLDSDDIWDKEFLKMTISVLESNPSISIVYTGWTYIDKDGYVIGKKIVPSSRVDYTNELLYGALFPIHAALTRKICFEKCGGFDSSISYGEDWHLWLRFALAGYAFASIPKPLAIYRRHAENTTKNLQILKTELLKTLDKIFTIPNQSIITAKKKRIILIFQTIFLARYANETNESELTKAFLEEAVSINREIKITTKEIKRFISFVPLSRSNMIYVDQFAEQLSLPGRAFINQYFLYTLHRVSYGKLRAFFFSLFHTIGFFLFTKCAIIFFHKKRYIQMDPKD